MDRRFLKGTALLSALFLSLSVFAGCHTSKTEEKRPVTTIPVEDSPSFNKEISLPDDPLLISKFAKSLRNVKAYESEITGTVKSTFYTQKIHDFHLKNGEEGYIRAVSTSALVNVGKEAYFSGDRVVMRTATDIHKDEWSEEYQSLSLEEYHQNEGNSPFEFSNYILNEETVLHSDVVRTDDGHFLMTLELHPEKSTRYYAVKMMNYGNLSEKPIFSHCEVRILFDESGNVLSLESFDTYKISIMGMKIQCKSEIREVFTYKDSVEIPNLKEFQEHL